MKDRLFLEFVLARQPTQSQLDRLLSVWDIEAEGARAATLLSYVQKECPELDFGAYTGPRLAGLYERNRFDNLRLLAHLAKIAVVLNAAGIVPAVGTDGALKLLRPWLPREMKTFPLIVEPDVFERTCALLADMGYVGEGTAEQRFFLEHDICLGVVAVSMAPVLTAGMRQTLTGGGEVLLPRKDELVRSLLADSGLVTDGRHLVANIALRCRDLAYLEGSTGEDIWRGRQEFWRFRAFHLAPVLVACERLRDAGGFSSARRLLSFLWHKPVHWVLMAIGRSRRLTTWYLRVSDRLQRGDKGLDLAFDGSRFGQ